MGMCGQIRIALQLVARSRLALAGIVSRQVDVVALLR